MNNQPRKKPVPPDVAAAAQLMGRLGGLARTQKQQATRAKNGKNGGRPRLLPRGITRTQYYHMRNIRLQDGVILTEKQQQAYDAVLILRKQEEGKLSS